MLDMFQITEAFDKYKSSMEKVGKALNEYSDNTLLDKVYFLELAVFSFLTGNNDMHLKNFSLFNDPKLGWKLAPGYDLLSTRLVIPREKDPEELALTLTGKKSNFHPESFSEFGKSIGLNAKQITNIKEKMLGKRKAFNKTIDRSFLSDEMKSAYKEILSERFTKSCPPPIY
jgi:serine/threonine-protein kinase HipA